ncbi:M1 family aminopeptidase [Acidianus brierleyi]|uniref:Peptidase M1 n=1 Tax=Acidianus brierleyi TaxID=41673 RepID=A0A2U9ICP2_9CREN|nr:M1 family aminopeptidase [Acidianus brierleyi]AWR93754.1 peptidase M1 [Acidianus brierleyi]
MSFVPINDQPSVRIGKSYVMKQHELIYPENLKFKIKHYIFDIYVNLEEKEIEGNAKIFLNSQGEMYLDALHFFINEIKLDNKPISWDYDGKKIKMNINGEHELSVSYKVKGSDNFRFLKINDHYEAANIGEVMSAPAWIPVVDYPGMKSTSEMIIRVKKPYIAVSNGYLKEKKEEKDFNIFHWVMDIPHSAYLNSLAVGQFFTKEEKWNDVILQYYLPKGYDQFIKNFSSTKDIMEFFSNYTGVKYPYPKYAQVVLFAMRGGMEYISSTHLTWMTLHDDIAEMDYSSDSLLSHEMAHQWFGDYVTTKDWPNIWLNEGFATYFQALYFEHSKGEDEFIYEMYRKLQDYLNEYKKYSRPIVIRYYKWAEELFDKHTYPKGALVLHTLRNYLGDDKFREGIKRYLEEHPYSPVDTEDFRKSMEKATGEDLTRFFDQFIYSAGHPVINVYYDKKRIRLEQAQDAPIYNINLEIKVVSGNNTKIINVDLGKSLEIEAEGEYVCVDPKFKTLKVVNDMQDEEKLIKESRDPEIMCRINAINSLTRFSDSKSISTLKELLTDSFWGVKYEAAIALGKIGNDEALEALVSSNVEPSKARRGVAKALGEFKFKKKAADYLVSIIENEKSYYVKADALSSLGKIGLPEYKEEIKKHFEEKSHIEVISTSVLEALSYYGDEDSFNFIVEKGVKNENELIRAAAAKNLGKFKEKALDILSALIKDESSQVRGSAVTALGDVGNSGSYLLQKVIDNEDEDGRIRANALRIYNSLNSQ